MFLNDSGRSCDTGLSGGPARAASPKRPSFSFLKSSPKKSFTNKAPSLYGVRNLSALGEGSNDQYDYFDGNLGKFKLKNVVKSVTKAATQVAKVAVKPAAIVAASSLQAVGLRNIAGKTGKALGLTAAEQKIAKAGGTVIDAAAITVGAVYAAPFVGAAATAAGHAAAAGGAGALGLVKKYGATAMSLFKRAPSSPNTPGDAGGPANNPLTSDQMLKGLRELRSLNAENGNESPTPTGPSDASPYGGGASAAAAPVPTGGPDEAQVGPDGKPVEASTGLMENLANNPKALVLGAAASILFFMVNRKKGKSARRGRR